MCSWASSSRPSWSRAYPGVGLEDGHAADHLVVAALDGLLVILQGLLPQLAGLAALAQIVIAGGQPHAIVRVGLAQGLHPPDDLLEHRLRLGILRALHAEQPPQAHDGAVVRLGVFVLFHQLLAHQQILIVHLQVVDLDGVEDELQVVFQLILPVVGAFPPGRCWSGCSSGPPRSCRSTGHSGRSKTPASSAGAPSHWSFC